MSLGTPFYPAIGTVVNVEDDPTQTGRVRVRWEFGAAMQGTIADEDLPFTPTIAGTDAPQLAQTGAGPSRLRVGSKVVGMPMDASGQNYIVTGSLPSAGTGDLDTEGQIDSDLPQAAKIQDNNGAQQPRYGDRNAIVSEESIINFAEQLGGRDGVAAKFASITDSIGTFSSAIQGGGEGVFKLLDHLVGAKNLSGAIKGAPHGLKDLKQALEGVPFETFAPSMSAIIQPGNLVQGVLQLATQLGSLGAIGNLGPIMGQLRQLVGDFQDISELADKIKNIDPQSLASLSGIEDLTNQIGQSVSLTTSLTSFVGK